MNAAKRPAKLAVPSVPAVAPAIVPAEMNNAVAYGDGVGAVYAAPWPVAGERRARRGSSPVYKNLKFIFMALAGLAILLLGIAAVVAGWNPNLSGGSYLAMTIALVIFAGLAGIYVLRRLVMLAAIGVGCALAGAVYYGLSRSMDRGQTYVPARIEGGAIIRGPR